MDLQKRNKIISNISIDMQNYTIAEIQNGIKQYVSMIEDHIKYLQDVAKSNVIDICSFKDKKQQLTIYLKYQMLEADTFLLQAYIKTLQDRKAMGLRVDEDLLAKADMTIKTAQEFFDTIKIVKPAETKTGTIAADAKVIQSITKNFEKELKIIQKEINKKGD